MTADLDPLPDWVRPPPEGFQAADLDRLPELPHRAELIDGSLVFPAFQSCFHSVTLSLLQAGLQATVPPGFRVRRDMSVILNRAQRPKPDLSVVAAAACVSRAETFYHAADVSLVTEVVSPDSAIRDRERKPQLYAQAAIPHFWLVENDSGRPVVHVFTLRPAERAYDLTGIHHDRLKLTVPFEIDIDLTEIDTL
ncbi:Uma2 family endonuclease [Nonomuraea typhae]|uniref:Uma2 family endonuclease n=1 Tax=Nonomuraea typhae TaxID=2603600 RepID=A0ABW7ZBY3_9ACTN